jgi:hypothetical protein
MVHSPAEGVKLRFEAVGHKYVGAIETRMGLSEKEGLGRKWPDLYCGAVENAHSFFSCFVPRARRNDVVIFCNHIILCPMGGRFAKLCVASKFVRRPEGHVVDCGFLAAIFFGDGGGTEKD